MSLNGAQVGGGNTGQPSKQASKGRGAGGPVKRPRKSQGGSACQRCRDRKQKCVRAAAIGDICGQCIMRGEECIWPPNSEPAPVVGPPPTDLESWERARDLHNARTEIGRLSKMVELLQRQLGDRAGPPAVGGSIVPLHLHAHRSNHHPYPSPSHYHQHSPSYDPAHPQPFGFSISHVHPSPHTHRAPGANSMDGAKALLSLSESPVSAVPSHPTSGDRNGAYPEYPSPESGGAQETVGPSGEPPASLRSTLAARTGSNSGRNSPSGGVRLPSLRLTIPSASPSPGPLSSAHSSVLRSAYPFASSPMSYTPVGGGHHPFAPHAAQSPSHFGPHRPISARERRHVFLSPSINSPASALEAHRETYPPLLFFVKLGASEGDRLAKEQWAKELASPMKRKEARELHEKRYDRAVGELLRGKKGRESAMAERPYSARSRARTAMKASRPAGSEEATSEEVQAEAGPGPRASALAGAMRVGSADAMLGGSILPSPVDRLLSPAKERGSREGLGMELSRILESEAEQDERPAPRSAPSGEEPAEVVDEGM